MLNADLTYTPDLLEGVTPWPFKGLRRRWYRTILADPPWAFQLHSEAGDRKSPQQHYACLDLADIQTLPVSGLAHPDGCALVMWATAPMLPQALATLQAWHFEFKTMGAWAKQSRRGRRWAFGTGYIFRSAMEPYLVGTRGRTELLSRSVRNLIIAPTREHSRKPEEMRADIERLFPGPRVELFARELAPGWDAWGNETTRFTSGVGGPQS
ncbi:MT-A70 family methyltransferase [Roseomonas xinghualingensis]|uniref:MT-A70 family methyltransferase n=1 Tax=Roseomonas xinghualingensis TaxID=2986475 RepID=UPI0021F2284B|nr:MT-A70 family methyltransferase [Roseomonas sp. SXEYE001]MCV4206883.1 MT-A70 family methyltransferase [Roseomonas sp. SXEYE001]